MLFEIQLYAETVQIFLRVLMIQQEILWIIILKRYQYENTEHMLKIYENQKFMRKYLYQHGVANS